MLRIEDMLQAAEKIERYIQGLDFTTFAANEMAADAVTRNLGIIGEAARHIPEQIRAQYPDVPWRKMAGLRNVVIHDYPAVDLTIIWATSSENLPMLVPRLREILDQGGDG
jgi:uncharacterized protein with HEPN domain